MQHLDVAGGTGDVAFRVLDQITQLEDEQQERVASNVTPAGTVVVCDINPDMLAEGRRKAHAAKLDPQGLDFVEGNAESLPFPDCSYDAYTIAFGSVTPAFIPVISWVPVLLALPACKWILCYMKGSLLTVLLFPCTMQQCKLLGQCCSACCAVVVYVISVCSFKHNNATALHLP